MPKTNSASFILALIACLFCAGCSTPYQEYSSRGGYSDFEIEETKHFVSFTGNGYTDLNEVRRYAKYRAAEIAADRGYSYFKILEEHQNESIRSAQLGTGQATDKVFGRPMVSLVVRFYESPPEGGDVLNVDEILNPSTS
ncbi:MAG: hypothetical protein ABEK50_08420 [bacterium]